jgi:hypothetical protein
VTGDGNDDGNPGRGQSEPARQVIDVALVEDPGRGQVGHGVGDAPVVNGQKPSEAAMTQMAKKIAKPAPRA